VGVVWWHEGGGNKLIDVSVLQIQMHSGSEQTGGPAMSTGGEPMNPSNVNRKLAEQIEPHWYQTNVSLSQPPKTGADRPVRGFVTNVSWRA
jgi:hypothetical protein